MEKFNVHNKMVKRIKTIDQRVFIVYNLINTRIGGAKKMEWINFRVEQGERSRIKHEAHEHQMNISEYIRFLISKERESNKNIIINDNNYQK